ncbi:cell filamentation protein Fic [Acidovorax carolinensis]|uniref:Cell filamentation protein Fic n=1 Tax=Acidovorax carolinensis TaxID=553814 RepID=A0A240U3L9_9BURK|nr:Fic family protein [Acidovorax carolinensis]ART52412.1 cell filamentation protein Fic [Acidovorax carolinensis]
MQKETISDELTLIERTIGESPSGVGVSALEASLTARGHPMPRRTLQRRLDGLLVGKRIVSEGGSRSIVYKRAPYDTPAILPTVAPSSQIEAYVPLSAMGLEVRDAIRKPLTVRKPVGYDRSFLERYRPNVDHYLSESQRIRLHELGRTSMDGRPAGTYARDILGRLLIDLSWSSSRLEGNTYNRLDTQLLIERGQVAEGKNAQETQMILNHKAAIEMIVTNADEVGFNRFTILNLHAILSDNLMADPMASGRLRVREVEISGTVFLPLSMPQKIAECFELVLGKASEITDPFEQAFFGMVHLPYLQPFEDVNKRVSRLAANISLIRQNLCPLSFVDVPDRAYIEGALGIYELNRTELLRDVFIWAYERSCQRYLAIRQSIGEPDAFRLKYRTLIIQAMQEIIRRNLCGTQEEIDGFILNKIHEEDRYAFVEAVQSDLENLYEGNIARYQLRLSEYQRWGFKRSGTT